MTRSPRLVNVVTEPDRAAEYRATGLWTGVTLAEQVRVAAETKGQTVAVADHLGRDEQSAEHTYADLHRDAQALAAWLCAHGLGHGDVVSVQLPNRYEAVVAVVATLSIGAVLNPLLPNYRAHELDYVFRTVLPRAFISPSRYRGWDYTPMLQEVIASTSVHPVYIVADDLDGGGDVRLTDILDGANAPDPRPQVTQGQFSAGDVSEVIFTSGTEAEPKAIMHTEETTNFAVRTAFADLAVGTNQVVWMPSPVGHSTGLNYGVRAALYHGRTLVLQDRWDAADAIRMIRRYSCSFTLAATAFLQDLVTECERSGTRLTEMTHFGCGGAPVPPQVVERAADVGIVVLRLYGSTEVLCGTWNRPTSSRPKRTATDGLALSHTEIQVHDEVGKRLEPPATGEMYLRGPNASVGYYNDPLRTEATYLADGWVRSGDIARIDGDGYITIVGRKKEIIIRGGMNIAPREIEDVLMALPEIERVAVVGLPDPRLGERACACVVLHPGKQLTFSEMIENLKAAGLASYKLPEQLRVLTELPTTASGKVQKHVILRDLLEEAAQNPSHEVKAAQL
jgi:acyl-coenzyme A synthetase/AMP-(fatty) acid ligase